MTLWDAPPMWKVVAFAAGLYCGVNRREITDWLADWWRR